MSHTSQTKVLEDGLDPQALLARAGGGKTIERYAKNQKIALHVDRNMPLNLAERERAARVVDQRQTVRRHALNRC